MDEDGGSGALARIVAGDLFDVEAGLAVAGPLICLVFAGLARDDLNLVGDHEDGVEADAELADEVGVLAGVAGELGEEVFGAGAGDGAEVRDEVFLVHADAGVGDGEGLVGFVEFEVDARRVDAIADESLVLLVGEGEVAQLVERIGGVGDEFAEEDFRVRVERMDDQLEELAYFSLELLFGHGILNYCEPGLGFSTRQLVKILSMCCLRHSTCELLHPTAPRNPSSSSGICWPCFRVATTGRCPSPGKACPAVRRLS